MLDVLRRNVSGWLAKFLIAILVLSFAVWGVADMITGVGQSTVARVGSTEISAREFQTAYQEQVSAFVRRYRRQVTPQLGKLFQTQVVDRLVGGAAVDNHAAKLNLGITQDAVVKGVTSDKVFQAPDGTFSQQRLNRLLQQAGYTEAGFIEARSRDEIRGQVTGTMLANVGSPKILFSMLRTYQGEQRIVKYFTLDPKTSITLKPPSDPMLKQLYDKNLRQFMTPEYRKVDVLLLSAADAIKLVKITEAELKAAFERDKASFATPEQRQILQLSFKDEAVAKKARDEIIGGKAFEDVAKAMGAKDSDIDLGLLTSEQMIDQKIAKVAFALEKGKVSEVVKGQFSTVLLMAKEIKLGRQPGFEEVKPQLQARLARRQSAGKIRQLRDQVDDNRLAGKSLKEVAALVKVTFHSVDGMDQSGKGNDGKAAFKSPDLTRIAGHVFRGEVGVESGVIELSAGGYAWINLIAVTPEKQKPFDAVRADVKKLWEQQERRKKLKKLSAELIARIKKGETFEAVAESLKASIKTTPAFKRVDRLPDLSPSAVSRVFALPIGTPAAVNTTDRASRIVFEVTEVKPPAKANAVNLKKAEEQVVDSLRNDIVLAYVTALRKAQGVQINQIVIDRTIGTTPLNR